MESAIMVKGVTKSFRVHMERNGTLKERVLYAGRQRYRDFTALQDVSLDIKKGSTVGLIGVNGSGKSTLLKLMSRILYPDTGSIEVHGRVSSLLELGAGFHPDFTGRENIYMNGSMLGLSKREVREKLDEIIAFSELGDFIEEPVRSYSSGMYMRLAFAVAVAVDPEILLIDEILAVGDAAFQAKCMGRLKQLQFQGKTIVIVTHDTSAVERFCDTVVWMHNSRIRMQGEPVPCIQAYLEEVFRASSSGEIMSFSRVGDSVSSHDDAERGELPASEKAEHSIDEMENRWGSKEVEILNVRVFSKLGPRLVRCGEQLTIRVEFASYAELKDVVFGVGIFDEKGLQCYGTNTYVDRLPSVVLSPGKGAVVLDVHNFGLLGGTYDIDIAIHAVDGTPFDYWRKVEKVTSITDKHDVGISRLPHDWKFELSHSEENGQHSLQISGGHHDSR